MTSPSFRTPVAEHLLFKGRSGDARLGEWVKRGDTSLPSVKNKELIVYWGCPDDTGVTLNRGRAGAKEGPDGVRKHLYRMTPPMNFSWEDAIELHDQGNLVPGSDILETQRRCRDVVAGFARADATIIAVGGGHDFAAPNFLGFTDGWIEALQGTKKKPPVFSLLNVDPHLDVRELENDQPHSGTPFRQILESGRLDGRRFVEFGARANRNARHHYQYCLDKRVAVLTLEELRARRVPLRVQFQKSLKDLAAKSQLIGVTFDMDSCADAEGVSAAPVLGFDAAELCEMAELAGREPKVRILEIAEVAPELDYNERSARIAAEMIYFFLRSRALRQGKKS